jgi:hypothetical protein
MMMMMMMIVFVVCSIDLLKTFFVCWKLMSCPEVTRGHQQQIQQATMTSQT